MFLVSSGIYRKLAKFFESSSWLVLSRGAAPGMQRWITFVAVAMPAAAAARTSRAEELKCMSYSGRMWTSFQVDNIRVSQYGYIRIWEFEDDPNIPVTRNGRSLCFVDDILGYSAPFIKDEGTDQIRSTHVFSRFITRFNVTYQRFVSNTLALIR